MLKKITLSTSLSHFIFLSLIMVFTVFSISCGVANSEVCIDDCFIENGIASWYGHNYPERCTANGETYNPDIYSAAHKTLPFNTLVRIENLGNGKSVTVRINDRGPFIQGRVIDLSKKAASKIDILTAGLAEVEVYLVKESDAPEPDFTQGCEEL